MDVFEKEILKYEKKGFKIDHKRTLKHGLRKVLFKKGGLLGTDVVIYLYCVDGDASTDSFREFFKDYGRYYEEKNLDPNDGDRGLFVSSGYADEKLFRDLRKAMIRDDDARNSIKLLKASKSRQKEDVEEESERVSTLPHEETERIIHRVGTICCYPNCKETVALDVHHILPRSEGGTNRDGNLIVLCPTHHRLADRGAIPRKRLEMHSVEKMEMGKKQA
jgi:5-methylcytosine-specific restriction endonuclease McrA